jgi:hypothetical protein
VSRIHATATTPAAFSGANDPFLAPGPDSSVGWRSATRKFSTDESMPDYASHTTERSRASEMSVMWERRDFQKHMDEAAVEEIIEALSPAKKGKLLHALSPGKSSSSGVFAPTNTPDSGGTRKPSTASEDTPKGGLSGAMSGNRGESQSGMGRTMKTRSMGVTSFTNETDEGASLRRTRSSSGSSKRKRSRSPSVGVGSQRLGKLTGASRTLGQYGKRKSLVIHDSSSDSDAEVVDHEARGKRAVSKLQGVTVEQ